MEPQTKKRSIFFQSILAVLVGVPAFLFWIVFLFLFVSVSSLFVKSDGCTIARIPVQGILTTTDNGIGELLGLGAITSADSIIEAIQKADANDEIEAILLDVDSPGGTPVAGDEIMETLRSVGKPVVGVVRDRGTSAAYWALSGADYIVASPVSDVGSIGVTMSYLESASSSVNKGSRWIDISSGGFKDAGNPERVLSSEEQAYFKAQVDSVHEYMVSRIAESRQTISKEALSDLADGRAFLGTEALELKLIDAVGGFSEALTYLRGILGQEHKLELCPAEGSGLGALL